MKTIRIYLKGNFQDGYLYGGQLFLIENRGRIISVSLWDAISKNLKYGTDEYHFFQFIFSQNNWLKNESSARLFKISSFKGNFDKLWKKFSQIEYQFTTDNLQGLKTLQELEVAPTLDMKIYGMRMFVGNGNGLYEGGFTLSQTNEVILNEKIDRVFDASSTNISAKSGSVMISSNSNGLFHGQLFEIGQRLKVKEKAIVDKSIRSGWSGYDVVNYESQNSFDYLKSEFSKTSERQYLYQDESDTKKISIDNVGTEIYALDDLLINSKISVDDIVYSFNSSTYAFFFLKDGSLAHLSFRKDQRDSPVKLSSKSYDVLAPSKKKISSFKPISTKVIPNGCVIEYFDKVVLVQHGKISVIENNPIISFKTYPSSIRYRNVITLFDGEGVAIHSVYPFD